MTNITTCYSFAELSLAAYATLTQGSPNTERLKEAGFSDSQAAQFASTWSAVAQYPEDGTGVSATVFKENASGKHCLAIRGTELSVGDLSADALLALGLYAKLNPQYLALKTQMDKWLTNPAVLQGKNFSVAGHSLGGYLATAIKGQYGTQVTDAYTYNAPGTGGAISTILNLFGLSGTPTGNVWNLRGSEGLSVIAGLGSPVGARLDVQTEPSLNAHSIVLLTDALKVSRRGTPSNDIQWRLAA